MRLGFNTGRLAGQRLGVGRYLEYMINNWAEMLRPEEHCMLYLRQPLNAEEERQLSLNDRFTVRLLQSSMSLLAWENLVLPRHLGDIDVFFGPSYTIPVLFRGKAVVAIHSVNEAEPGAHPWWYNQTYSRLHNHSGHKAIRVIVPCETTRADVMHFYGVPEHKIDIVPQGADTVFRPVNDEARLRDVRLHLLGEDVPYVLFVGKLSQRRNIPALIEAFAMVKKRRKIPHKLLLFGPNHLGLPLEEIAAAYNVGDSVVQADGRVANHKELVPIYSGADVFVHPSLYEGWSMTTMEALACGTATVATNRGGLGEIANGHALTLEDPNPEAIADAVEQVLTDGTLRKDLEHKARARGSSFTWEDTTLKTLEVLREVASS